MQSKNINGAVRELTILILGFYLLVNLSIFQDFNKNDDIFTNDLKLYYKNIAAVLFSKLCYIQECFFIIHFTIILNHLLTSFIIHIHVHHVLHYFNCLDCCKPEI